MAAGCGRGSCGAGGRLPAVSSPPRSSIRVSESSPGCWRGTGCSLDRPWLRGRLDAALRLRRDHADLGDTDACRLVNGEGDGLPGLTVDRYGDYLMVQLYCSGWRPHLTAVTEALQELLSPARDLREDPSAEYPGTGGGTRRRKSMAGCWPGRRARSSAGSGKRPEFPGGTGAGSQHRPVSRPARQPPRPDEPRRRKAGTQPLRLYRGLLRGRRGSRGGPRDQRRCLPLLHRLGQGQLR